MTRTLRTSPPALASHPDLPGILLVSLTTYRASEMGPGPEHVGDREEAERTVINGIVDKVVAQALAARKAGG